MRKGLSILLASSLALSGCVVTDYLSFGPKPREVESKVTVAINGPYDRGLLRGRELAEDAIAACLTPEGTAAVVESMISLDELIVRLGVPERPFGPNLIYNALAYHQTFSGKLYRTELVLAAVEDCREIMGQPRILEAVELTSEQRGTLIVYTQALYDTIYASLPASLKAELDEYQPMEKE